MSTVTERTTRLEKTMIGLTGATFGLVLTGGVTAVVYVVGLSGSLAVVNTRLGHVEEAVKVTQADVNVLKTDVAVMKSQTDGIRSDVAEIKGELREIKAAIARLAEKR